MTDLSPEVRDALFQQKVTSYMEQDVRDKAEMKADLKAAREDIANGKINVAVLQTKSGIIGAISGALIAGVVEFFASLFHKS